jgi:hypothetical protein
MSGELLAEVFADGLIAEATVDGVGLRVVELGVQEASLGAGTEGALGDSGGARGAVAVTTTVT